MARKHTGKAKQRVRRSARGVNRDQEALAVFDGLCREVLATQGREVLASHDPLQAEMWVSHLLGLFGGLPMVGQPDPVAAVGGRLVSAARRSPTPQAQMCLRALAAVAGGLLGRRAETAAQQLGASRLAAPRWIDAIGTAEPTTAWRATDWWGDQDAIMIGFAYPDGDEHSLVVLVDHPLGGIAKDAAVLGPLAEVVRGWQETPDTDLVEEPVGVAAARVMEAVDWTTRTLDPPVTEDYNDTQALLRARLAPLAAALPGEEPLSYQDREALVRAFLADRDGAPFLHDPDAWFLIDCLVNFRCDRHGRDPLRWSSGVVLLFLLDWVPRKLSARHQTLARMPELLRAWLQWGARRAGLPGHLAAQTLETLEEIEGEFNDVIADESKWGPAKRLAMGMLAAGVDPGDTDAANAWLAAEVSA